MASQPRSATLAQSLPLLLVVASFFLPYRSASRGWLAMSGFTMLAMAFFFVPGAMSRRYAIAFSAYMLVAGLQFGLPDIWRDRPAWWDHRMMQLTMIVVAWVCMQSLLDGNRRPTGTTDVIR
jgi:thiol:disulfide interchange protein